MVTRLRPSRALLLIFTCTFILTLVISSDDSHRLRGKEDQYSVKIGNLNLQYYGRQFVGNEGSGNDEGSSGKFGMWYLRCSTQVVRGIWVSRAPETTLPRQSYGEDSVRLINMSGRPAYVELWATWVSTPI